VPFGTVPCYFHFPLVFFTALHYPESMPRAARIAVPGNAHHITQRGNNQQDVFFVDEDRRVYLRYLGNQSRRHGLTILAYCLMTNHVHIVGIPFRETSLARAIGVTNMLYTQYINRFLSRLETLLNRRIRPLPAGRPKGWRKKKRMNKSKITGNCPCLFQCKTVDN